MKRTTNSHAVKVVGSPTIGYNGHVVLLYGTTHHVPFFLGVFDHYRLCPLQVKSFRGVARRANHFGLLRERHKVNAQFGKGGLHLFHHFSCARCFVWFLLIVRPNGMLKVTKARSDTCRNALRVSGQSRGSGSQEDDHGRGRHGCSGPGCGTIGCFARRFS